MKLRRLVPLILGLLLLLPGFGMLLGGIALGGQYAFNRDADGYFTASLDRLTTDTAAITSEDIRLFVEPGSPDWMLDRLDADIRFRVSGADGSRDVFVGIGPEKDIDAYLSGASFDRVVSVDNETPEYRRVDGDASLAPPGEQTFWVAQASGTGTQELNWEPTEGRWVAVLMNTDGSPSVAADIRIGAKAGFVLPLAWTLGVLGILVTVLATVLVAVGINGPTSNAPRSSASVMASHAVEPHLVGHDRPPSPVTLTARLDTNLSRWQWLVKWALAIPHFIVLVFLWMAFTVLTLVAGVAILFTGRYPRSIFDFNVGVMRWSWRVSYYASNGGIGTDRYPPFSLSAGTQYPATLDVEYPDRLSRGLVLVKWLLAIPHFIIVGLLVGGTTRWATTETDRFRFDPAGSGGVLGLLVLVAGLILLFSGTYPKTLFDLIMGLNRWVYRVIAYAALMTDQYPPFRLDQGGAEPPPEGQPPRPPQPSEIDLRQPAPESDNNATDNNATDNNRKKVHT